MESVNQLFFVSSRMVHIVKLKPLSPRLFTIMTEYAQSLAVQVNMMLAAVS